jgi:hypothetical protein
MYACHARAQRSSQVADFSVARWPGRFGMPTSVPPCFSVPVLCHAGNRHFSLPLARRLRKSDSIIVRMVHYSLRATSSAGSSQGPTTGAPIMGGSAWAARPGRPFCPKAPCHECGRDAGKRGMVTRVHCCRPGLRLHGKYYEAWDVVRSAAPKRCGLTAARAPTVPDLLALVVASRVGRNVSCFTN